MSFDSYSRRIECIIMENACNSQELDFPAVFEVIGEPAIVITGVPDVTPCSTKTILDSTSNPESDDDPCFGDWMEGRKVQKLFGDQYYSGKVEKYDSETKWYRVVYEDGDFEDLEWHELEQLLLPLDISIPLTILASHRRKLEKSIPKSRIKLAKRRKNNANISACKGKTSELLQISQVGEPRDVTVMEANFSERTRQGTSQMQNGLQTENQETYFLMCKNDESLSSPGEYTATPNTCDGQESESTPVFEVIGEPATVINGVPNATPGYTTTIQDTLDNQELGEGPCFGEWLEGRRVQKLFGDQYYSGKVEKYDKETKWYRVVYEDGDFEDLEWPELEEVLLPLDISVPVTILASHRSNLDKSVSGSRIKLAKGRKNYTNSLSSKKKTSELLQISQARESRDGKLMEANFSGRTRQETLQMQNVLQTENQETFFLLCKNDEALLKPGEYTTPSNTFYGQESYSTPVFEVIGEPAIVINGVPDATPGYTTTIQDTVDNPEPAHGPCFGEWLEGRMVQKFLGDRYYLGKVEKYDKGTKWYRVIYEDGDFEDLEWHQLEDVLVPLDISIPLTTLPLHLSKSENFVSEPGIQLAEARKNNTNRLGSTEKTAELLHISRVGEPRDGKLVEADVNQRIHQGNSQIQKGLQIESIEPCPQMFKHVESASKPEEGTITSKNNQHGEKLCKMLNMIQTPGRADINGDGLVLADSHREPSGQESLRWQRDFQKQSWKTARAEKQRRRENSFVEHSAYHPK